MSGCCGSPNEIDFTKIVEVCRVCELLDKDTKKKPVSWCDICGAFVCKSCTFDLERRTKAMVLNWGNKIINRFHRNKII